MKEFGSIPIFVTVVETGGFSLAARRLGVSKSAVSKRVSQLENHLGVRLLHRTTRRLSLTEAGERYFERAVKALALAGEAESAATELQSRPQGRLRIKIPMSFGRLHIAPLIPRFLVTHPGIQVDVVMDDRIIDLIDGGFDAEIRAGDLPDSSLVAQPLVKLHSVICASPKYITECGRPDVPAQLTEHNCLLFSYSINEWMFIKQGDTETIQVSGNCHINNSEALREAAIQGIGLGRFPTFVVGPDLACGNLIHILPNYQMPHKTLHVIYPERQHIPAKARVFIDFIIEHLRVEIPNWDRF